MLSIIVSLTTNNAIGYKNQMIFNISEDLKRFKKITSGHTIIMGRKTFESLPGVLPNRKHVIITSDKNYINTNKDVTISNDLQNTLEHYKNLDEEVFVIGGESIFKASLPYVNKLYLTHINKFVEGDTYFDTINYDDFVLEYESEVFMDEKNNITFKYSNYIKGSV